MVVAAGAPDLGQTPSSPSSAQYLPQAKCSGIPYTLQKVQQPKKCLWFRCAKLLRWCREPARGRIHTPRTKPDAEQENARPKERRRGPSGGED